MRRLIQKDKACVHRRERSLEYSHRNAEHGSTRHSSAPHSFALIPHLDYSSSGPTLRFLRHQPSRATDILEHQITRSLLNGTYDTKRRLLMDGITLTLNREKSRPICLLVKEIGDSRRLGLWSGALIIRGLVLCTQAVDPTNTSGYNTAV